MSVHVYMCFFYRFEMIDAARNKIRVKAAYVMMAATIGACMIMVFLGKRVRIMNESCMKLFFFFSLFNASNCQQGQTCHHCYPVM